MLGSGSNLSPVIVRGILPSEETNISELERFLRIGSLVDLEENARRIVLGRTLALNLGVGIGDRINLLVPQVENGRLMPRLSSFFISGLFEAGIQDHDARLALVHLSDASQLKGLNGRVESLAIHLENPLAVSQLQNGIGSTESSYEYSDWALENSNYFRAIRIEKTMMALLLLLIVAVAAFNIVASLMMVVTDKQKDIAILRCIGPQR